MARWFFGEQDSDEADLFFRLLDFGSADVADVPDIAGIDGAEDGDDDDDGVEELEFKSLFVGVVMVVVVVGDRDFKVARPTDLVDDI